MASVIDQAIPDQAFEILRDRIGLILAEELAVQYVLKSLPGTTPKVFVERFAQIDATECPVINVMLDRGDYDNQDPTTARGTFNFSVDVYTTAASKSGGVRGDATSVIGLHKLMGICRAIIQDARYIRLGFDPGFVMRRQVTSIQIADQTKSKDANNAVMGRLNVLVAAPEVSGFDTALAIGGFDTQVKLHSTELGYVFSGDDLPAPPITGSEIKVNGALLIDLQCGNLLDIALVNSDGDEIGQIIDSETVLVGDSTVNLINSDGDQIGSASVAAEQTVPELVPDGSAKNSLGNVVADVPAGGEANVDDSLLSINSSPYLALPATVNRNIEIQYEDDTPVGTVDEEGIVRIPNQATFDNPEVWFNGIKVAEPASGETWFQIVKVNGELPDSVEWDSPNANFNLIKAGGGATLTIGVFSDSGATIPITLADYGDTIYIKATATAIQDNFTLFIDNAIQSLLPVVAIDNSATHVFEYTINLTGTLDIYVIASDNTNGIADSEPFDFTVTGFYPPSITGNVLWVDAATESTYVLNGTFVQQLNDLSGLSNHLSAPTVGNQPLYLDIPDGINNLRSTQYSSGRYLRKLGLSLDIISGSSIFIVVNFYASANGALISTDNTYNGGGGYMALEQNGLNIKLYATVAGYTPNYPISLDTNYLIEVHRTPTQERLILNGVTLIARAIGTTGNRTNFWANTGFAGYPAAKWGDIAVFNNPIPSVESDLRNYLMTKWNIV